MSNRQQRSTPSYGTERTCADAWESLHRILVLICCCAGPNGLSRGRLAHADTDTGRRDESTLDGELNTQHAPWDLLTHIGARRAYWRATGAYGDAAHKTIGVPPHTWTLLSAGFKESHARRRLVSYNVAIQWIISPASACRLTAAQIF